MDSLWTHYGLTLNKTCLILLKRSGTDGDLPFTQKKTPLFENKGVI